MEDRWLSVDEIATYLGVKRDTNYTWIAHKSLPADRVGRLWKFKRDEVDEWVWPGNAADDRNQKESDMSPRNPSRGGRNA